MRTFDRSVIDVLKDAEDEFRNLYWRMRASRGTDWKALNRARVLAEVMAVCGVPKWAIKEARYCLRLRVCGRCVEQPISCHELSRRAQRGDFS